MKKVIIALTILSSLAFTGHKNAYVLFNEKGKEISYDKMIKELSEADVVLFGEFHNNTISHWLELEVAKSLHENFGDKLVLGAEMFEADNQLILNEYLSGVISEYSYKSEMRLWSNYSTDYKPLVEFSKDNWLPMIASNVPRRYASKVYREGFEGLDNLSEEAKSYLPPLPIPYDSQLSGYQEMMEMDEAMGNENFPKAQAIKDCTMAYNILRNLNKDGIFLHYHGAKHSMNHEGIEWYLNYGANLMGIDLKVLTISTVEQAEQKELDDEFKGEANYIICVDEDVTKTY